MLLTLESGQGPTGVLPWGRFSATKSIWKAPGNSC